MGLVVQACQKVQHLPFLLVDLYLLVVLCHQEVHPIHFYQEVPFGPFDQHCKLGILLPCLLSNQEILVSQELQVVHLILLVPALLVVLVDLEFLL